MSNLYKVPTLLIIRGLPGTGKTSLASMICAFNNSEIKTLSLDDYRYMEYNGQDYWFDNTLISWHVKALHNDLEDAFRKEYKLIIIHNTHTRLSEYAQAKKLAEQYKYRVMVINMEYESFDVLCERSVSGGKLLDRKKMQWMRDRWQYIVNPKPLSWYTYRIGKFFRKIRRSISGGRKAT